ncbi:phage tail protein [Labrenzia sp. R4_1]|uniref:phage tail protein n=1 Tax=Labrenzia sp. R4_1 TaxID=2821106 RepID=UPI00256FEA94|nr:phage tail protein [Labrenzia sp. R4_1]
MLTMRWGDVSGMKTLDRALSKLSGKAIRQVGSRALNRAGSQGRTQAGRALAKQTGLKARTIRQAMKPIRASAFNLEYQIKAFGGDVALKHFAARETRRGVSAAPFGRRQVFAGTFMKGGRFPSRVDLGLGGQVFTRVGSSKFPIEKQRSGVVIPAEMIKGESAKAWQSTVGKVLPRRVVHEIKRATGKAFG